MSGAGSGPAGAGDPESRLTGEPEPGPAPSGGTAPDGHAALPAELRDDEPIAPRRIKRPGRRALLAGVAGVAALALAFSGCSALPGIFPGLFGEVEPKLPPAPSGTVESFGAQEPEWVPCAGGLQCAAVHAPVDWSDPAGETIALRLVKQPATGGKALGTLFVNPGGPGASGYDYVANGVEFAVEEDVAHKFDVVGWDPRGVGRSTPVACLDAKGMDEFLFGEGETAGLEEGSEAWIDAAIDENRQFGEACLSRTGNLLGHVDTASTVRDLDMLRAIAGDDRLNYLGYSYGTYIGARYADLFPDRVGRLVLDGAMDPSASIADVVREQTKGFEAALRAYVTDCLGRDGCPFEAAGEGADGAGAGSESAAVDAAMARIGEIIAAVDETPLRGSDGRLVTAGTLLTAIITPLYSESNWPLLDDLFESVPKGSASTALLLADFYYDREDGAYTSNSTEAFTAINCLDYPAGALDPAAMRAEAEKLAQIAPTIGKYQGYGELGCAGWPVEPSSERGPVKGVGAPPILVIGTTGDPATPYEWAVSLADQLESGVLVTYRGEGHTAYGESECVNQVVDDYLIKGVVPGVDPVC